MSNLTLTPWVWQGRRINGKFRKVKIKKPWPTNPRTEAQQLNRQKFAVANLRWQILDEKEKDRWRTGPVYPHWWGCRYFIRDFMLKN